MRTVQIRKEYIFCRKIKAGDNIEITFADYDNQTRLTNSIEFKHEEKT